MDWNWKFFLSVSLDDEFFLSSLMKRQVYMIAISAVYEISKMLINSVIRDASFSLWSYIGFLLGIVYNAVHLTPINEKL